MLPKVLLSSELPPVAVMSHLDGEQRSGSFAGSEGMHFLLRYQHLLLHLPQGGGGGDGDGDGVA